MWASRTVKPFTEPVFRKALNKYKVLTVIKVPKLPGAGQYVLLLYCVEQGIDVFGSATLALPLAAQLHG